MLTRTLRRHSLVAAVVGLAGAAAAVISMASRSAAQQPAGGGNAPSAAVPTPVTVNAPPGAADGRITIELQDVPDELALPASAKANHFVTAVFRGSAPRAVWLARAADAPFSVPLPPTGDGRYQINLADERVVLALRRTGGSGQCYVFAKGPDDRVFQSAAVRFMLDGPSASYTARVGGTVSSDQWLRPLAVTELGVGVAPSLPGQSARVTVEGGQPVAMKADPSGEKFSLAMTPELRAAWEKAGWINVDLDPPTHQPSRRAFRAIPSTLAIPPGGLSVTGKANSTVDVPGSNGYLRFRIGGVRNDEADVVLERADERSNPSDPPIDEAQVFRLGDAQYVWVVSATTPGRAEERRATMTLFDGKAAEQKVLLTAFRKYPGNNHQSNFMTFNGRTYSTSEAAEQLRELYEKAGADSVATFVEAVAAREREKNSRVMVQPSSGSERPLATWVVERVRDMGWEPLPAAPAAGATTAPAARVAPPAAPYGDATVAAGRIPAAVLDALDGSPVPGRVPQP